MTFYVRLLVVTF